MATKKAVKKAVKKSAKKTAGKATKKAPAKKSRKARLESQAKRTERARKIFDALARAYPDSHCALNFKNAYELSVATILSAQCTDKRVNMVTPDLFKRWPDAKSLAKAPQGEVEEVIRSTGFYRNKAKNLIGFATRVVEEFGGKVPGNMDDLRTLPGFGRKTANVILGNAYGVPGITVDTHMGRLSRRMGLTSETDPVKVEFELMKLLPGKDWTMFSHRMIDHGRRICDARKPLCEQCPVEELCPKIGV